MRKSHMGLTHCQAHNAEALDFFSLSSINVMRKFAREYGYEKLSIGSVKMLMHNAFMLERFIPIAGKSSKLRKNDTDFKELLFLGVRDAAWTFMNLTYYWSWTSNYISKILNINKLYKHDASL